MIWLLTDDELRALLARAAAGEEPDAIEMEMYANSRDAREEMEA